MKPTTSLFALLAASLSWSLSIAIPTRAAELADGTVQFDQAPALVESGAMNSSTAGGLYYFTIDLPRNAGEPLAGVIISPQSDGDSRQSSRDVEFDLDRSEAFLGTPKQIGTALSLQQVEQLPNSKDVRVTFAQPVRPGTMLTIGLKPSERPSRRHDYRFGLSAFPVASTPAPVFLGYQTLSFRGERYRDYPFWWSPGDIFPDSNQNEHRVLFWDLPSQFDIRLRHRN